MKKGETKKPNITQEKKKKINFIRINRFLESNPTLWSIAWAFLWRGLVLFFALYVSIVIIITLLVIFSTSVAAMFA